RLPGRGLPARTAHEPPRPRHPGGTACARHPHRHERRPAGAAAAAAVRARGAARGPAGGGARVTVTRNPGMQRFLDLADFSRDEIVSWLALARRLEAHPEPQALAGRILGLVFFNPSLRTLASFQAGMARLGGSSFVITPGQGTWQLETRLGAVMNGAAAEHVREGLPVLASYCDALGIRAF